MREKIITAISNCQLIEFYYDDNYRCLEPHTFGVLTTGNEALSGYQIDGQSSKGDIPNWRLFKLEKIEKLKVLKNSFSGIRDGYQKGDKRMKDIYAEL